MRAAVINHYGDNEVIEINENHSIPDVQEGQVVVEVHAASINCIDAAIRSGCLGPKIPSTLPLVMGGDFSGIVRKIGANVVGINIGDKVYGQSSILFGGSGSMAEFTVASATSLFKKPKSVSMAEAAAFPLAGATALLALEEQINIQPGQKILIHSGSGGISSIAIQLAKYHGAYVATTVDGCGAELARSLGADEVIDCQKQSFTAMIQDYDAVIVTTADTLTRSYMVLKNGGVLVSLAGPVDECTAKDNMVTALSQMTQASARQLERLATLIDAGNIKPVIDQTFSLSETKEAFNYFEQSSPKGKVVVQIR